MDFDPQWLKRRVVVLGCAFLGSERWPATFRGSNFLKTVKDGLFVCTSIEDQ